MCVREGALTEERIYSFLLLKEGAFKTMLGWEEKSQADDMMIRSTLYPHTPRSHCQHTQNTLTMLRTVAIFGALLMDGIADEEVVV